MDINEAYGYVKKFITTTKETLGLRTAQHMEKQALESKNFPLAWVWAAGAYVMENNKEKFSEMISKAAQAYDKDIKKSREVDDIYRNHAEAITVLAENPDAAYDLIASNLPAGASRLGLAQTARMLFGKAIIENMIPVRGGLEGVISSTKNAQVIEEKEYMVRLNAGALIFQAYDLGSQEGKSTYENSVKMTKKVSGMSNLPTFLAEGVENQPGNSIGWYLTKI